MNTYKNSPMNDRVIQNNTKRPRQSYDTPISSADSAILFILLLLFSRGIVDKRAILVLVIG